ncbi:pitrilysin family protein [Rhodoferax sp. TBRC 17660]|uniref:Pitrilysin family protein n=1 Tax=Rhodoferax potami TaxID=3068338 RepID=A0ABU3KK77_9BURK|nr:pitrilysin family protein [Rhodoferax sp. TBRC 17660]MDT7518186.1 pitrilysin family protein [Rhodoferax sp. TBRC 17660]
MKHPFHLTGALRRACISWSAGACALALISASPLALGQAKPPVSVTAPLAQQFTLKNGMTLIVKPDRRAPTAVHMLWVRVGSMDEVDGSSGVAHVLEHMMFKGTPTVKAGDFSRQVAALGGRENAFTSKDYTGYFQQIPSQRLEDVMRLEADRFANSTWTDEDFRKELEVVKEERRLRTEDKPHARLHEAMDGVTYQADPYRRPIVGWMSDLESLQPEDARDFYRRWYTPTNAAVVVAGDVEVNAVRALAEKYYGSLPARAVPLRKPRTEPEQAGLRRLALKAPAEQAYVALSFKVPGLRPEGLPAQATVPMDAPSEDALALTVLSAVLSGYDGARLPRALTLTEPSVADSAGAYYGLTARGPQLFTLYGVPAAGKTAAEVEAALRAQIALVAKEGVTEAELLRVKNRWVAGEVYKQDSVFNQARLLGVSWINGFALGSDTVLLERLRGVSAVQVQSAAARYFGDDALTVATLIPQPLEMARKPRSPAAGMRH